MNELELLEAIKELEDQIDAKELVYRNLTDADWDTLVSWWKWWKWPIMPRGFLPKNGTGGIMIEKNDTPIVAGFLYETNSEVLILEWIISNPKYKETDREKAIELLVKESEKKAKKLNYKYMFSVGRNKYLVDTHEKLGWNIDRRSSHEMTKKLK
tara:strand:- start:32 stop:496 length:465 start_codon:yes stop_codon:yes gene_type:complete